MFATVARCRSRRGLVWIGRPLPRCPSVPRSHEVSPEQRVQPHLADPAILAFPLTHGIGFSSVILACSYCVGLTLHRW